jgi:hypothetical protein
LPHCSVKTCLILFFALTLLASFQLQAAIPADLQLELSNKQLHKQNHWLKLLHFRSGESEIDDERFFLAPDGKTNPENELSSTIEQLIVDRSDDDDSSYCRFIARASWLLQELPALKQHIQIPRCQALHEELAALKAFRVTLILASAHINSPASAFGHTFLRIDSKEDMPLVSYAVSYAAQTTETNGFIYAYRGIFGGYNGKYSILPYYEKIKEYNDLEQRDVWEYQLNLTSEELRVMALHIMEIRPFDADYYFFSENCAYNILWLLEVARDEISLTSQFKSTAIPIDTLRAVEDAGLVTRVNYRPSARKNMNAMMNELHENEALEFVRSQDYDLALLADLSKAEKSTALELAIALLKTSHRDGQVTKKSYTMALLKLLRERSKLGLKPEIEIPRPDSPMDGHYSRRISVTWKQNENQGALQLGIKPSYHDPFDVETGYLSGAFISFADTTLSITEDKTQLEQLKIVDIQSYALQDKIFSPLSWQVGFGFDRPFSHHLKSYLKAGAGKTVGKQDLYAYLMLTPELYYDHQADMSLTFRSGLAANWKDIKLGLSYEHERFSGDQVSDRLEVYVSYAFSKEFSGHIRLHSNEISAGEGTIAVDEQAVLLSGFYYF